MYFCKAALSTAPSLVINFAVFLLSARSAFFFVIKARIASASSVSITLSSVKASLIWSSSLSVALEQPDNQPTDIIMSNNRHRRGRGMGVFFVFTYSWVVGKNNKP